MNNVRVTVKAAGRRRTTITLPQAGAPAFGGPPGAGVGAAVRLPPVHEAALEVARELWPLAFAQPVPLRTGVLFDIRGPLRDTLKARGYSKGDRQNIEQKFLSRWCNAQAYLAAVAAPGAVRIKLDGSVVCPVSPDHAAQAAARLKQV